MKAKIEIQMDNDAFQEAPGTELCTILRSLAERIEDQAPFDMPLYDSNGNRVGTFTISES